MTTTTRYAAALAAAALCAGLAGCGQQVQGSGDGVSGPTGRADSGQSADADLIGGFPRCDWRKTLVADPSAYRAEPVYANGGGNDLMEQVSAWASEHGAEPELWIDREHNGWLHVGTTHGDAEALQAQVEKDFPGAGIAIVDVPHSSAELRDLQDRVSAAFRDSGTSWAGVGAGVPQGVTSVDLGYVTPEAVAVLEQFRGEPLCVEGRPPSEQVPEGPQPTAGDGWRLLADQVAGESYRTGVATTPEQLERLWDEAGVSAPTPPVDFSTEVVIWFGAVDSSSCPVRMDDVEVSGQIVHGVFVVPGGPGECTADAIGHAVVVAVERAILPDAPFFVQLGPENPPVGGIEVRTVVDVDLRSSGATAGDGALRTDPALREPVPVKVEEGGSLPLDEERIFWFEPGECGWQQLGTFDGIRWRLADDAAPPDDLPPVTGDVSLTRVDAGTVVLTIPETDLSYIPAEPAWSCDGS